MAPMPAPDDPHLEELRALRTRAYGPDADIHDDAAALARLPEPEAPPAGEGGEGPTPPPTVEPRMKPTVVGDSAPNDTRPESVQSGAEAASVDAPVASAAAVAQVPWWRRRIPVLWTAAGVVVGVVLGIGVSLLVQPAGPEPVAVLQADADAEWPSQMFGARPEDGRPYEEFHGLTVIAYERGTDSAGSQSCLAVLTARDGSGFAAGGCGAAAFPANVSMEITSLSPRTLRDEFPEGTSLQFVHDGTQVTVYAARQVAPRPTP